MIIDGKYELVAPAGEGGMATVWRGVILGAAGFARSVAVKRIQPMLAANREFVAMFVEEARLGSSLIHPNIVQIFDFGIDAQGIHYLVMEWVEGLDLGRFTAALQHAGRAAPWPLVAAIMVEALRGLAAAHSRVDAAGHPAPVIHRDITPANILIGTNGIAKLSDFGLARAMDRARMTQPDVVKGKLGYLAPELTHGKPATVQSDLFGVGIVLWETLAGRPLYEGRNEVEVFMAARRAEVPPLGGLRPDLPAALAAVVERAVSREPEGRFASAEEMIRALTAVLRQVPYSTDSFTLSRAIAEARRLGASLPPVT